MRYRTIVFGLLVPLAAIALGLSSSRPGLAQVGNQGAAGVAVDAEGVLRTKLFTDAGGQLSRQRVAAAKAGLNPKVATPSKLRKVSLTRLEKAIAAQQGALADEMRYLAGLFRVRYVFLYPETKDIVLAGPAEGWVTDPAGRVVGLSNGRPVLQLQDLVVALRAFPPGSRGTPLIGCSIDPTQEGLAAMQQFLRSVGSHATPGDTQHIVEGLHNSLGLQVVRIDGISPKTHFAQVMVEADYRMKLIGIGLEKPPVRMVSYVERANPSLISRNAMQRWFFTPDYQCVRTSEDKLAMELVGDGVKLVGEDELVTAGGQRQASGLTNKASQMFVSTFTKKYSELAERSPVYAELRNLIDLAVVAAFMQREGYYGKAGWKLEVFGNEASFAVETLPAPKRVETAVNAIWRGNRLMTPVGGGVQILANRALDSSNLLPDEEGTVSKTRQQLKPDVPAGQWWWD